MPTSHFRGEKEEIIFTKDGDFGACATSANTKVRKLPLEAD